MRAAWLSVRYLSTAGPKKLKYLASLPWEGPPTPVRFCLKTSFLKLLTAFGMPLRLVKLVTALAMALFCLDVCQRYVRSHRVSRTYGPDVKTALDAAAQSAARTSPLDLISNLILARGVMAAIRSVSLEAFSNDLEFEDMIHVPWGTVLNLIGVIRNRNWRDLWTSGSEYGKGRRRVRA